MVFTLATSLQIVTYTFVSTITSFLVSKHVRIFPINFQIFLKPLFKNILSLKLEAQYTKFCARGWGVCVCGGGGPSAWPVPSHGRGPLEGCPTAGPGPLPGELGLSWQSDISLAAQGGMSD